MNALRPLRALREAESLPHSAPVFPRDEFLPHSVLQDPKFSVRIKREAHQMRNEAIRNALTALTHWIVRKARAPMS